MLSDKEKDFNAMVATHSDAINKICFCYAASATEAADMRQDTLLNLWRGWQTFRGDSALSTWIHRVCLNTCVSYVRRENRHRHADIDRLPEVVDESGEDRSELWAQLQSSMQSLSKRERAVMILWLEDFSYDDIADVIGLSRNGIASLIFRIKQKLINLNK